MLTKDDFIAKTLQQIRWKKAHERVEKELSDHIDDQKNAFLDMNMTEEEAEEKAVLEMGDAIEVGTLLDSSYRPKTDKGLIIMGAFMALLGIIISCIIDFGAFAQPIPLIGMIIGIPLAFALPFLFDVSQLYKHAAKVSIIYIIFLFVVAIFAYQSYTLARMVTYSAFLMPVIYTVLMCRMRGKGYVGFLLSYSAMIMMTVAQVSMTSGVAFTLICCAVCVIMSLYAIFKGWFGGKIRPLGFLAVYGAMLALYLLKSYNASYFTARLMRVFAPLSDPQGYGWTAMRARDFLSRAVFIGQGSGEVAYNNIAGYHTDYALTNLIHSFGWIILVILGTLTIAFLVKIFLTARKQTSQLAKSVSYTVLMVFTLNTILYFAVNMGIIGSISTCPAFLFGGKISMAVSAFLLGVVASTNRNGSIITDKYVPKHKFKVEKIKNQIIITLGDE